MRCSPSFSGGSSNSTSDASNIATVATLEARDIRRNHILGFRLRTFDAANRTASVASELTRALHRGRCPTGVGAVPAVSGATFKAWRDHAE